MDSDLPFNHQNTHMNITVLIVDVDPLFLSIISNMLKTPTYIDKSFGEITVMTANDSSEALSTLRYQCNNVDVVITDYHMPGLNGLELKRRIREEFGNLPVIVVSAEMNEEIEQEILSSGSMCFMRKPIKPNDLNIICKHALNHKINGGSTEIQKTNSASNPDDGSSGAKAIKKSKITWTSSLENHFCQAIQHIGVHKATPTKILEFMNLPYLTRAHVASKLQKYRKFLKKVTDEGVEKTRRANIQSPSYINLQHSYNYKTSLSNNNLFNFQSGYGIGHQSSPTMNNKAGFHGFDNHMKHRSTYNLSQTGSNSFPRRGSLGVSNGMFALKEDMGSMYGPSQESQAHKFGQYGTTRDVLGMNSNLITGTTGSNYAGIRIDEKGDVFGFGGNRVTSNSIGNGNGPFGRIGGYTTGNGSLAGTRVQGYGNGNASLGENLSVMNWNFDNNNMSNLGSSTSRFPSTLTSLFNIKDQSQNYLNNVQPSGVVPSLENPNIFNDYHGINEFSCDTVNLRFDQNQVHDFEQHQDKAAGENPEVPTAYPLEDISNWNFSNGIYNEETQSSLAVNSEMYIPTDQDMNITNQENVVGDLMELPLSFDQDSDDGNILKYLVDHGMN